MGPKLVSPVDNDSLRIAEGVPVRFIWERVNYANNYIFNLFLVGREQPLREVSSLNNNSVMIYFDTNTAGRFRWTVQGFSSPTETATGRDGLISQSYFNITSSSSSALGDQISWTVPRIANMQAYYGEVDSPIKLLSPVTGINIPGIQALRYPLSARWTSDVPLRNIQLIVSRTTDPVSDPGALVMDVNDASAVFPSLNEGIWYWIIRAETTELRGVTPGDPFWVNVLPIPPLPAPETIQPPDDSIIDLEQLTRDRNITFRWEEMEEANAYIFSLYMNETTPALLFTVSPQTELFHVLENLSILKDGEYFWQVEAVYINRNGVLEQRGVIVQHPFRIEVQQSPDIQTHRLGTTYGQ